LEFVICNLTHMLIGELGEFGLIERFKSKIKTDASVIKGSGDDCAVIKFDRDNYLLFTCDMIVEGVDFTRKEKPNLVGRKALAVSLSDIAACGGLPRYAVVSLGLPKETTVKYADMLAKGIFDLAKKYGLNIVGGDISKAKQLTIDVSMLGVVEKKNLALRKGAKKGDVIFVSGSLGGSIFGKHLKFTPRLKEARFLVENFKISSMIDISDGLAQDLGHILKNSNCGALIHEELIPLSRKARGLDDALYAGEDFELLFTMPPLEAKRLLARKLPHFKAIGRIIDKKYKLTLIEKKNQARIIEPKGFRHF
jgi:thiamine-monophosphate kinase